MRRMIPGLTAILGLAVFGGPAGADERSPIEITLKDHQFTPAEIHVPAGKPAYLHITNEDATPDEFEMRQLAIEKVVAPGGSLTVRLRPLGPGRYAFIGEFYESTAHGVIIAE